MTTTRYYTTARNREATAITAVLAVPCGLACAGSVIPGLDDIVTAVLVGLAAVTLLTVVGRWVARWVRERREDAADALTAAHWRATHAPHLLAAADRVRFGIQPTVAACDVRVAA